jgi:2-oxoglutarate dehydrogenase E2 component (dihydrolipoamide succinyltransferase)
VAASGAPAKEPASGEQPTTSSPEPRKDDTPKQEELKKEAPAPPQQEKKPAPPPPSEEKPVSRKDEKKLEPSPFGAGGRGENRVCPAPDVPEQECRLVLRRSK